MEHIPVGEGDNDRTLDVSGVESKVSNNESNFHCDQLEHERQWKPFGDAGFLKCYIESKAHLILCFRHRNGDEFIACIQNRRGFRKAFDDVGPGEPRFLLWSESASHVYKAHGQEQPVLVKVIEPVQIPEAAVPSVVWLDSLQGFTRKLPYAGYEFANEGWKIFGTTAYWKLGIRSNQMPGGIDHSGCDVIESAAKA